MENSSLSVLLIAIQNAWNIPHSNPNKLLYQFFLFIFFNKSVKYLFIVIIFFKCTNIYAESKSFNLGIQYQAIIPKLISHYGYFLL